MKVLTSKWFITLIGVIVLSLLIWFVGPLIPLGDPPWLSGWVTRLVIISVLFLIWLLAFLIGMWRRSRANRKMINELAAAPVDAGAGDRQATAEEAAVLRERMQDALALMKRADLGGKGKRQYLYQLPWYILIGPPGSGKTTALINSGLTFPLADRHGRDPVRGIGGTRNCDWWFTNEAVLIDTAGRYTTQDSHQAVDAAAWTAFLELLRKYRRRQPINGALVAISLSDIATQTEAERLAHARAIRQRLRELQERLGVRYPVYVLFTKADLVAGFIEFYDDLGREEREQVWGMTFPLDDGSSPDGVVRAFSEEFDLLIARLNDRLVERLHQEQDMQRRSLLYGFPQQVASLKEALTDFLEEIFQSNRFEARPLLRGVYMTSGTQDGTPIDRLLGAMANAFGIGRQALTAASGAGRSYFLTRLLRGVVFPEASVVSANRKVERRRMWVQRIAYAAVILVTVGMAGLWTLSLVNNQALIAEAEERIADYNALTLNIDFSQVADADLQAIVEPLNVLRQIPGSYGRRDESVGWSSRFGLYQGNRLGGEGTRTYGRALNSMFLPRLMLQLEQQLRSGLADPEILQDSLRAHRLLYEPLRTYLILAREGPMDEQFLRDRFAREWERIYPGIENTQLRADLATHLDAMLDLPWQSRIAPSDELISVARGVLNSLQPAGRAYAIVRLDPEASNLQTWSIVREGGQLTERVFTRISPAPLSGGVDGLYTYRGFHFYFLPAMVDAVQAVADDSWVLGPAGEVSMDQQQIADLEDATLRLYLNDYVLNWERVLGDIAIVPFRDLDHTVQVLNDLSGPDSPLRNLLRSVSRETKLSVQPEGSVTDVVQGLGDGGATGGVASNLAAYYLRRRLSTNTQAVGNIVAGGLGQGLGGGTADEGPPPPGIYVDERFRRLHEFVDPGEGGTPSRLDALIDDLYDAYRQLNDINRSIDPGSEIFSEMLSGGGGGALGDLQAQASRLPEPVSAVVTDVVESASALAVGGAASQLGDLWQREVGEFCTDLSLGSAYPFNPGAQNEILLNDFAELFGPQGRVQQFFDENLAPFVDRSSSPWQWRQVNGRDLGISSTVLQQFEFAADIRQAFFGDGSPGIRFELTPVDLSPSANQVVVDVDGEDLSYEHGIRSNHSLQWPGPGPARGRISFLPQVPGSSLTFQTTWGWFRLLDSATIRGSGNTVSIVFSLGGNSAEFRLSAGSAGKNPFALPALRRFRCPATL